MERNDLKMISKTNGKIITASVAVLTAALCLSFAAALTSCKKVDVGVVGGADGPTDIIVTSTDGKTDEDKNAGETDKGTSADESSDVSSDSKKDSAEKDKAKDGTNTPELSQNGIYTFANGETVEVPKDVSMYVGTVTEGTMNTVSVEDPSGEVYIYARDETNYANDGEGLLVGDKATVYYEKDITEALFIVTEHNYLAKIDPSWSKVKGKVKDAAMSTVTIELPDGTTFGYERNPAFYSNDGNGITIGDNADVYYVGDLGDKDSFEVRYVYTEKGEDSLGE